MIRSAYLSHTYRVVIVDSIRLVPTDALITWLLCGHAIPTLAQRPCLDLACRAVLWIHVYALVAVVVEERHPAPPRCIKAEDSSNHQISGVTV